jgi:hypothetical protein
MTHLFRCAIRCIIYCRAVHACPCWTQIALSKRTNTRCIYTTYTLLRTQINRRVGGFSGREMETLVPGWALDCVWSGQYAVKEQPTVHFFVMPHPTTASTAATGSVSGSGGSLAAGGSTSSSHSASSATSKQVMLKHLCLLIYISYVCY